MPTGTSAVAAPTVKSVMAELKRKGTEKGRAMYARHGMPAEYVIGVSVADLKVIAKAIKGRQELAYELYDTGVMDAMYLAGMVADGSRMTKAQLDKWAAGAANLQMIAEYTVPWVAVENPHGREMATKWMKAKEERIAAAGWCTYSGLVCTKEDSELDLGEIEDLLNKIVKGIGSALNRVRHTMNNFVIATGVYVKPLTKKALASAQAIGPVSVEMGGTACKVPLATAGIQKAEAAGKIGKKKKTIRC
jgi:3-methyladenine DNA glycosylase AlkD